MLVAKLAASLVLLSAPGAPPAPVGVWLGQDGHDVVGPSTQPGPNGIQDAHIQLRGLPAGRRVVRAVLHGYGWGEWQYNGPAGWRIELVQAPGSSTADLYFEPGQRDTARPYDVALTYDDGSTAQISFPGGGWDPTRRMPDYSLQVRWVGQDGQDLTGPGPCVGPDGREDVHLVLSRLFPKHEVASVKVTANGAGWQYGLNPEGLSNAELVRRTDDRGQADLYFSPDRDLAGQTLAVSLVYAQGGTDTATVQAGPCDARTAMPRPASLTIVPNSMAARWLGQDGGGERGDVHVRLAALPGGRAVRAAALSDPMGGYWTHGLPADGAMPLRFAVYADGRSADLYFPPIRDETGGRLTLRLVYDDGAIAVAHVAGGKCDPLLRAPALPAGALAAHPGDDLNDLCNRFGTLRLTRGEYALDRPLVLSRPVHIVGELGATLVFTQPAGGPAWTAAIKVHCGGTTLEGFSVRFAGPVRWNRDVSYGPAVIGATDPLDGGHSDPKVGLIFRHLDIQAPPVAPGAPLEEAPRLFRMANATSGEISGCILKGGVTEVFGGPWRITDNEHRGVMPGTFAYDTFAGHGTHDMLVARNRVHPTAPCGKTWRFVVTTGSGAADVFADNQVTGVGMRDDDTIPNPNAPEVILTEAYSLHFEGRPAAISADGRLLYIPKPQGWGARSGDVVSVLSGPSAGTWRRVAQAISPTVYLMESPLPAGDYAVSIATGFVGETYARNVIDCRGSSGTANLVLVGNHYGARVVGNRFVGGGEAMRITAAPTEQPVMWGWSHAPFLGGVIEGNVFEDGAKSGTIAVEHNRYVKTNRGRVYMTLTLRDNVVRFTAPFASRRKAAPAVTIGDALSLDPAELALTESGNRLDAPAGGPAVHVWAAAVNGRALRDGKLAWPGSPRKAAAKRKR